MVAAWPEPVQRVSSFLREAAADARIEEFATPTASAAEAAGAIGCKLDQIVKSLVLTCDDALVVALVPGDRKADLQKVARAAGSAEARVATAGEVERSKGFAPGAVPPFPLPVETVLLDRRLLRHPLVWAGAGSPRHVVGLAPVELGRLARARPADLVADYDSPGQKES